MTFAGERYYNIYRVMFTSLGLWPYQKPILLHTVFIFSANMTFLLFQLTAFLTRTCNFEYVLKQLSYVLPSLTYFTLYNLCYFNTETIKRLFDQIKTDWNTITDVGEIKILEKYAFESLVLTLILVSLIVLGFVILIVIEITPVVLDAVAPINESRPRQLKIVDFELFIDEKRYFHIYLIHEIVVVVVSFFSTVAAGTLLFAFLRHSCAIYKISSNLIENLVTRDTLELPARQKTRVLCWRISRATHMRKKSIQFYRFLMDNINKWFFFIMAIGVLSLSCNLIRFLNAAKLQGGIVEKFVSLGIVLGHFIFMFLGNLIGQSIMDHSAEVFYAAYNTMWYLAPLSIQKLLLFMMQCSLKSHTLIIGGFFVASLEGFSTLATTSISYFTVIYTFVS